MTPTYQQDPAEGGTAAAPAVITPSMLRDWPLPQPGSRAGKDVRGRVLVAGGSQSTPGPVLLAGVAAILSDDLRWANGTVVELSGGQRL